MSKQLNHCLNRIGLAESPFRRGAHLLGCLSLIACCVTLSSSDASAQVPADAIDQAIRQLEMLDTPTDDLIRLSEAYADSVRDLKTARLSLKTVEGMKNAATVTNLEVQIASLNLEAAERKMNILRMILNKQLAAAQNKLTIVGYLQTLGTPVGNGQETSTNFMRANDEATVRILKSILAMN